MILLFITLIVGLIRFWYMPFVFFVQDEWYVLGTFFVDGIRAVWTGIDSSRLGHFVPLGKVFSYVIFSTFGVNSFPYNILAITAHSLNVFLVFKISQRLISSRFWKLIPPLVFLSSFVGYEQVNWPIVGLNSFSVTLSLWAWYLAFDVKERDVWKMFLIPILLSSSVLIIESALPIFIFISGFLLATNKDKLSISMRFVLPILIILIAYLGFRSANLRSGSGVTVDSTLTQVATRPIEYLAQSFIPQPLILKIGNIIANDSYVAENQIFPVIARVSGLLLLLLILFLSRKSRSFLIPLFFILFFSIPFLFVPGTARNFSIFPSRYLYYGSIGSSLIFGLLGYYLHQRKSKFERIYIIFIVFVIGMGLYLNFSTNRKFYYEGKQRLKILNEIRITYPDLPQKAVFFIVSDRPYYGLPSEDHILPFQSGLGQTLLVWYSQQEKFPDIFYRDRFLWEIKDQGYKEADGRGFGYFRDLNLLKKAVSENSVNSDSVFAFSWNGATSEIKNISDKIRHEIY